ncbi:MAG: YIP1 family protein [Clostridia bacterium]|nr:YIP1 family protein [Clostridia bacterium]
MKKKTKKIGLLIIAIILLLSSVTLASPATSFTWTINSKGKWTKTQDAYLPEQTLISLGLKEPEDLFVYNEDLYIADTGNKRIVVYNIKNSTVDRIIEDNHLKKPRGIYVTEDYLYVADSGSEAVLKYKHEGDFVEAITKPTDIAFGNTPYKPMKVAVDSKGNLYLIGEGVLNGIIQLSNSGKFLGYFASNKVELNFVEKLQNMFFTEAQMENLQSRVPITMTNTFVDHENIVYSTTIGFNATDRLAKHNTAGNNIFNGYQFAPDDLIDVYVDDNGVIYAASLYGLVWVYSNDGMFVHAFGGNHQTEDIAGLFSNLNAIAVDHTGRIWAADSQNSYIQSFVPTSYATEIYEAIDAFKNGHYSEAETLWLNILKKNQMLRLAHEGLGKIYLYTERYEDAMKHLEIARSKYYFSQAYWEVRNKWLQSHLTVIIVGLILLMAILQIHKFMDKKKKLKKWFKHQFLKLQGIKWLDDLLFLFTFLRHPIDAYYDLKIKKRGSLLGAVMIYIGFFFIYIHSYFGRDFLFSVGPIEEIDFNAVILSYFSLSLLFVFTNYLVTSIKDGDGSLKEIFMLVSYASAPLIIGVLSITGLSYILTYNEAFFIDFIQLGTTIWFAVIVVIGLIEVHQYTTKTALQSIVMSVLMMLVIAIVVLIVILMGEQVYDFFEVIVREVIRNVTS